MNLTEMGKAAAAAKYEVQKMSADALAEGLRQLAGLADPGGVVLYGFPRPNGL